jgi:hypothetical protein
MRLTVACQNSGWTNSYDADEQFVNCITLINGNAANAATSASSSPLAANLDQPFTMIRSKHNTLGFWTILSVCILLTLWFLLGLSKYLFGIGINFRNGKNIEVRELLLFLGLAFFWWIVLASLVKNITIDGLTKTISFQNLITRNIKVYSFKDFDGYMITGMPHDYTFKQYNTIGLVKNKRILRIIDSYFHSNYDELKLSLNQMDCLGRYKIGFFNGIRMILKYPVLE